MNNEELYIALQSTHIKKQRILIRPELIKLFTHGKEINKKTERS